MSVNKILVNNSDILGFNNPNMNDNKNLLNEHYLADFLCNVNKNKSLIFEIGGIKSSTGADITNAKRARIKFLYGNHSIVLNDGYLIINEVLFDNSVYASGRVLADGTTSKVSTTDYNVSYTVKKIDESDFTNEELDDIVKSYAEISTRDITELFSWVTGFISYTDGLQRHSDGAFKCSDFVEISKGYKYIILSFVRYTLTSGKRSNGGIAFYDINKDYIRGYESLFGANGSVMQAFEIPANARYIRTTYLQDIETYGEFKCCISKEIDALLDVFVADKPYSSVTERFTFPTVDINKYNVFVDNVASLIENATTGMGIIKLATNYSNTGKPTPLIMFFHGTGGFNTYNSSNFEEAMLPYIQYLTDCGYNVCAIYPWSEGVDGTGFATPFSLRNYIKGYEYIKQHYNIEKDGVYLLGRSAGCYSLLSFAYSSGVHIKAAAIHSGAIGEIKRQNDNINNRSKLIKYIFENDANYEFTEQYLSDKFNLFAPYENLITGVVGVPKATIINAVTERSTALLGNCQRIQPFPCKIWVAMDDTNINPQSLLDYANQVSLAGGMCEFRCMPSNYTDARITTPNAHHITDTHSPSIASLITEQGILVENMSVGYYETIEYFKRFG